MNSIKIKTVIFYVIYALKWMCLCIWHIMVPSLSVVYLTSFVVGVFMVSYFLWFILQYLWLACLWCHLFCGLSYVICGWRVYGVVFSVVYLTIFVVGVFMVFSFSVVYLTIFVVGVFIVFFFCGLSCNICGWRVYGVIFSVVYLMLFVVGVFMVSYFLWFIFQYLWLACLWYHLFLWFILEYCWYCKLYIVCDRATLEQ